MQCIFLFCFVSPQIISVVSLPLKPLESKVRRWMVQDMWKQAQQGAWKQCLWLEKTLAALHPWVQPCLWPAGIPPVLCWAPQMQRKPKPCLEIITTRLYFHFREENNADHMLFPVCQALPQVSWWHFLCWLLSTLSSRKFRAGAERNHRH